MSGYFEIGIFNGKKDVNVGTLWRSASQLGASGTIMYDRVFGNNGGVNNE